ncbi:MAG: hypothetical protein RXS25_17685 [Paraburkholderia sp.]
MNIPNRRWAAGPRLITGVCAVMLLVYLVSVASHDFFWDLSVYERALRDLRQGLDPYRGDAGLPFVYHPLVLDALA